MPNAITRSLDDKSNFRTTGSWLLSLYDRLLRRWPKTPLPLRGSVVSYAMKAFDRPIPCRLGSTDALVMNEIFVEGEYEVIPPDNTARWIVDLGANCGFSAMLWLNRFPNARVLAVEPDDRNFAQLQANNSEAVANGRLLTLQACIGGNDGVGYLDRSGGEWAYSLSNTASAGDASVTVRSLASVLEQYGVTDSIDLLKVDIEGAEKELLETCSQWFSRVKQMIVEIHKPYLESDMRAALDESGVSYDCRSLSHKGDNQVFLIRRL